MSESNLIAGLMRPAAYPHTVEPIRLHETHISWVLMTGQFAYKVKKPVRLPFLDFSDLERRQHFCQEELRLNRRTAPELYLDVVPIAGTAQAPQVDGDGEAIDYAVRMRQFDDADRLDHVVAAGELDFAALARFGERLARFHAEADAGESAERGTSDRIRDRLTGNIEELAPLLTAEESTRLEAIGAWMADVLGHKRRLLDSRAADGQVREGHGDMHLRNLVRLDGEIQAFDCIEFDAALRWIDVMDDLAFPVMDLELNDAGGAASVLIDSYLRASGDYGGLELLDLYVVYRALVRAKVAAIERDNDSGRGADAAGRIARLLEFAEARTRGREPRLILMQGLPASGKSRVAGLLVPALQALRISSDVERKRLAGLDRLARSGSAVGGGLYTADMNRRTYSRLQDLAGTILGAGRSVIVDAAFLRHDDREVFYRLAETRRVRAALVQCTAPAAELERRVIERAQGPSDSEADRKVLEHARQASEPISGDERSIAIEVDTTSDYTAETVAAAIRRDPDDRG